MEDRTMQRIEISRETSDLTRKLWVFTILDFPKFHLEYYAPGPTYHRLERMRHGTINEEPEVPADVLEEALAKFAEQLEFKVWRNR